MRTDVTDGLRTRWQLAERDPELAVLMLRVYGRNDWLYSDTQPGKFRQPAPKCARRTLPDVEQLIAQQLSGMGSGASVPPAKQSSDSKDGLVSKARSLVGSKLRKFFREA